MVVAQNGDSKSRQNKQLDLRNFINAVADHGVHGLSANGDVTRWNVGASRLDGYDYDDIVGKSFEVFFEDALIAAQLLDEATEVGHAKRSCWRIRKDGTRYFAQMLLNAVRDDAGAVAGFACVVHDLTERRAASEREAGLQSKIDELESVSESLRALAAELGTQVDGTARVTVDKMLELMGVEPVPIVETVEFSPRELLRDVRDKYHYQIAVKALVDAELPESVVGDRSGLDVWITDTLDAETLQGSKKAVISATRDERDGDRIFVSYEIRGGRTQSFAADYEIVKTTEKVPSGGFDVSSVSESTTESDVEAIAQPKADSSSESSLGRRADGPLSTAPEIIDLTIPVVVLDPEAGNEFAQVSRSLLSGLSKALAVHNRAGAIENARALADLSAKLGASEMADTAERIAVSIETESLNDPIRVLGDLQKARRRIIDAKISG